ncbi:hypothetical protein [Roseimaritima sediminicola]|uniref:hypothetical protein n=1 Tax=Roseimaritima sediminicola TaxID=2662066 RepID=UPI0012982AA2|nr:hypothetical protein [Roseimaritima sediminicola]
MIGNRWSRLSVVAVLLGAVVGCDSDRDKFREIQVRQQRRIEAATSVNHLEEAFDLFSRLGESDLEAASRQINYHLNAWSESQEPESAAASDTADASRSLERLLKTWRGRIDAEQLQRQLSSREFQAGDVEHFRLQYLLHKISNWSLDRRQIDPWLERRVEAESLAEQSAYRLRVASRLFDWVIRNVQLEPMQLPSPPFSPPAMPTGLEFDGAGYRQTNWETLWRGSGDALQRAGLFLQLCRHAGLDACLLGLPAEDQPQPVPWMCGVLIDGRLYLFDTALGLPVPGPDEEGIATLAEARGEPSVLRRLRVAGVFEYPYTHEDIQQCIALLYATPELLSDRMRRLTEHLLGDQRMNLHLDAAAVARRLDDVPGVAGVRLWHVPLEAEAYQQTIEDALRDNIDLNRWYFGRWGLIAPQSPLGKARWRHLEGQFDNDPQRAIDGARVLYMQQRRPEFELADLALDVQLQAEYDLQRLPRESEMQYQQRIAGMQQVLRAAKRTATFWLALMHVEEANWSSAEKWLEDRVLDNPEAVQWHSLARYNLARTEERLENWQRAEQLYKTDGDPQEQGNRIRARLLPEGN